MQQTNYLVIYLHTGFYIARLYNKQLSLISFIVGRMCFSTVSKQPIPDLVLKSIIKKSQYLKNLVKCITICENNFLFNQKTMKISIVKTTTSDKDDLFSNYRKTPLSFYSSLVLNIIRVLLTESHFYYFSTTKVCFSQLQLFRRQFPITGKSGKSPD